MIQFLNGLIILFIIRLLLAPFQPLNQRPLENLQRYRHPPPLLRLPGRPQVAVLRHVLRQPHLLELWRKLGQRLVLLPLLSSWKFPARQSRRRKRPQWKKRSQPRRQPKPQLRPLTFALLTIANLT